MKLTQIITEYNIKDKGFRISSWGEKPLLIYAYNNVNGKKLFVDNFTLPPGHFYEYGRTWFTNWQIEIFEWSEIKDLVKIHTDVFSPYGKKTNFHLAEFDSIEDHKGYIKACADYINSWSISEYNIISPYSEELSTILPTMNFTSYLEDERDCYVSYDIRRTPSSFNSYENYGVYLLNEEIVNYNAQHPYPEKGVNSYDFAKSILFGPDYKNAEYFIPQTWTLTEKLLY